MVMYNWDAANESEVIIQLRKSGMRRKRKIICLHENINVVYYCDSWDSFFLQNYKLML